MSIYSRRGFVGGLLIGLSYWLWSRPATKYEIGSRVLPASGLKISDSDPLPFIRENVDVLKELVKQSGQVAHILAQTDGTVIGGKHMLTALRELGWSHVMVQVVSDEEAKEMWDERLESSKLL